jgi:serine/threonine protein kinase
MAAADHSSKSIGSADDETTPDAPREGDTVGSYRLTKLLGSGGMGTVFLAEHHSIGRRVAIKFLLPELSHYPDIVGRFFDEARSVNRINHENIVEVFDFVRNRERLSYIVMELLEGTDLYQTRKRDGPYPLGRVLVVCEQIASALTAAHKVGIVHRDLKPENVFLIRRRNNQDFVKLLDFGLAKLSADLPMSRQPTQAGIVMGTPGYMPPEQALGGTIDGRSDVFSLGVLLHWMLADKVPDGGPGSEAPERNLQGEELPDQMRALLTSCMKADPAERPQTMAEVFETLTDLRRQIRGTDVLTVMPRAPSRTALPAVSPAPEEIDHSSDVEEQDGGSRRLWLVGALGAAVVFVAAISGYLLTSRIHPGADDRADDRASVATPHDPLAPAAAPVEPEHVEKHSKLPPP